MIKQRVSRIRCVLFFALCVILVSCENKDAEGTAEAQAPTETIYAINTYLVGAGNLDAYLEFGGDVEAASSVDILPETSGKIASFYVKVGDYVRRNQLIARIDPSRPGMRYETSPVPAPADGTVTSLPFSIGATVAPSVSIGKISSVNDLEIMINVAERYVSRIKLYQTALLSFDAFPSETFLASVVQTSPVVNTTSRTMSVKLHLTQNDPRIRIGMYARVKLITDERKGVIIVPYDAIVRRGVDAEGKPLSYLFTVNTTADGTQRVRMINITEGIRVDDRVEIMSGIMAGDHVVVKGQTLLNNDSRVNVIATIDGSAARAGEAL